MLIVKNLSLSALIIFILSGCVAINKPAGQEASSSGLTLYKNSQYGFQFFYPSSWEFSEDKNPYSANPYDPPHPFVTFVAPETRAVIEEDRMHPGKYQDTDGFPITDIEIIHCLDINRACITGGSPLGRRKYKNLQDFMSDPDVKNDPLVGPVGKIYLGDQLAFSLAGNALAGSTGIIFERDEKIFFIRQTSFSPGYDEIIRTFSFTNS